MGTEEVVAANEADTTSDLENKIIRQVEYYFGNYNLCRDRFLKQMIKENDGWISMETMVKFRRLKMLSEDFAVITNALKKSPNKLIEVHEDGTKIRRSVDNPLPEHNAERKEDIDCRTVYVKGFHANTTLDELLEFFKSYTEPENIMMRRRKDKKFKGSIFATFRTKEVAETFQQTPNVKYKATELLKEMKKDYTKRKDEFYDGLRKARKEKQLKREQEREAKKDEEETEDKDNKDDIKEEASKETEESYEKGCLLKLTGLGETTMWEHIKEVLSPHAAIAYVDYSKGKPQAVIRFESADAASVLEKVATETDGVKTVKIKDSDAVATVIEGDEEAEYWKGIVSRKANMKQNKQSYKGWQNRGGRRGGGRGRGRFNQRGKRKWADDAEDDQDGDEPSPSKKVKKEVKEEDVEMKVKKDTEDVEMKVDAEGD